MRQDTAFPTKQNRKRSPATVSVLRWRKSRRLVHSGREMVKLFLGGDLVLPLPADQSQQESRACPPAHIKEQCNKRGGVDTTQGWGKVGSGELHDIYLARALRTSKTRS